MASIDSALEPILARYSRDPSALLQILRDAQDAFDWISPRGSLSRGERAGHPGDACRQRDAVLRASLRRASRPISRAVFRQYHRPHGRRTRPDGANARPFQACARKSLGRRPRQHRPYLLHRHVRPGPGAARQQSPGDPTDDRPHRCDLRPDPRADPARPMAAGFFPRRGQYPPRRHAARRDADHPARPSARRWRAAATACSPR